MERIDRIRAHIETTAPHNDSTVSDDDVVIVSALRTPITKAKRGGFKDTTPDILLGHVLQAVLIQSKVNPTIVQDIVVGNVLQPGAGAGMARMAQLSSRIPYTVPLNVVNRQCSSGLQAVANVVSSIKAGYYDVGIAAGVESMSFSAGPGDNPPTVDWTRIQEVQDAMDCTIPMGITSENVAEKYGISRAQQDALAEISHAKAFKAQNEGWFRDEITAVSTKWVDKDGTEKAIIVAKDDGVREGTTVANLSKLKAVFKQGGTTTAGNSSQVSDGAAAVLLMRRSKAKHLGLPILGKFVSYAVAGVPPSVMGIGPAYAIPAALEKAHLSIDQIDIFEINEAFASQAVYCVEKLGIPMNKVNPKGGAIALGHPLGCTGARQVATLLHELKRTNQRYGVISMCIGTGMGAAAILERE